MVDNHEEGERSVSRKAPTPQKGRVPCKVAIEADKREVLTSFIVAESGIGRSVSVCVVVW